MRIECEGKVPEAGRDRKARSRYRDLSAFTNARRRRRSCRGRKSVARRVRSGTIPSLREAACLPTRYLSIRHGLDPRGPVAELRCLLLPNCLVLSPPSALIWSDQNEVEESEICRVNEEEAVAKTGCELVGI